MRDDRPADRYAVIGFPVAHSYSPVIHAQFAAQTGERLVYERLEAVPGEFARRMEEFFSGGGCGLNVTRPHKLEAFRAAHELTPRARLACAVNTLSSLGKGRLQGDNTDGAGLVTDLQCNEGTFIAGRRLLVLGAGGAARGIAGPLLVERPAELVIANRNPQTAIQLAAHFAEHGVVRGCGYDELAGASFDMVINTTAASVPEDVPPVPMSSLHENTLCYDLAYGQNPTPFAQWASERRMKRVRKGWGMLVEQAAESFFVWRGVRPDTAPVLEKLDAWNRG